VRLSPASRRDRGRNARVLDREIRRRDRTLLAEGIGDTIRVSVTGPPHDEVRIGHDILHALGLERRGIESSRAPPAAAARSTSFASSKKFAGSSRPSRAALRRRDGLRRQRSGEAAEADVGVAGGKGFGFLFRGGRKLRKVPEDKLADELVREIRSIIGSRTT